jgi:hypothetical protein
MSVATFRKWRLTKSLLPWYFNLLLLLLLLLFPYALESSNKQRIKNLILINNFTRAHGDRGSTVVKVLRYKSEGRWFDPRLCHGIFH